MMNKPMPGTPIAPGGSHPTGKIASTPPALTDPKIAPHVDAGFGNSHANLMNTGKEDNPQSRMARLQAMKRRNGKAL